MVFFVFFLVEGFLLCHGEEILLWLLWPILPGQHAQQKKTPERCSASPSQEGLVRQLQRWAQPAADSCATSETSPVKVKVQFFFIFETCFQNTMFWLFLDSAAILHDELEKKPCRKFLQRGNMTFSTCNRKTNYRVLCFLHNRFALSFFPIGFCDFGPNCRFSHMSEVDLSHLRRQIEGEGSWFGCLAGSK